MKDWVLENEAIKAAIRNNGGGVRLESLYHKEQKKEWIYRSNDPVFPKGAAGSFDGQFRGGCEFLFPCDAPMETGRRSYPDHGFLWTSSFKTEGIKKDQEQIFIEFNGYISNLDTEVIIGFCIDGQESKIKLYADLTNRGKEALPYLFRFHPCIQVNQASHIKLYGKSLEYERKGNKILYCSPHPEQPAVTAVKEFFCYIRQSEGIFSIQEDGSRLTMRYPLKEYPILTLYYYGEGKEKLIFPEPSSSKGIDLLKQMRDGTASYLRAKERKHYELELQVQAKEEV